MTTKIKITSGKDGKELAEDFYQDLIDAGYSDAIVIAVPEDNQQILSMFKVKGATKAMAMIGMLIKFLAESTGVKSTDLATVITRNLERTEKKMEELENDIDITVDA
ncbi:MAG: hypothetical protein J6Y78_05210 [Paludibacteraceae bacterium]|nr:hypothetical protein [Paludibacteraceae bacterium]